MAGEQRQVTAAEVLQDFGSRFNAEAIRLGDSIHAAIVNMGKSNDALKEQNDALIAENAALKDEINTLKAEKLSPDEDAK